MLACWQERCMKRLGKETSYDCIWLDDVTLVNVEHDSTLLAWYSDLLTLDSLT